MTSAKILIVEDNRVVARDIQEHLIQLGYSVLGTTASGETAVQLTADLRPDLVLMDIRLEGDVDGIEAAKQIRNRCHVPVVYLTAHADEDTLQRARITQPFGYLLKPFDERQLHTAIEMALHMHQADLKLRESERRYAVTLNSIGDAVIATDDQARVTLLNPVAEALIGWVISEATGKSLVEVFRIINEHTRQQVEDPAAKVLRLGKMVGLGNHTLLVARDGREVPIDDCGAPIIDDRGNITGVVLVFHDVTNERRAEAALRESEERFRSIFETALIGMAITDLGGLLLQVNHSYQRMIGYSAEELRNVSLFDLTHPGDRAENCRIVEDLVSGRLESHHFEKRCVRKDGTLLWADVTYSTIKDEKGDPRLLVCMMVDITERKRVETEREELHQQVLASRQQLNTVSRRLIEVQEEERRRLARELHDELGQVLTAVSLNIEATRQSAGEPTRSRLGESMQAIDRAIEDVRSLSLNLRPAMLDIMGLESALRWYLDRQAKPSGLKVEFVSSLSGKREDPEVETACFRIVQEALTNACRHAQASRVCIELSRDDGTLQLAIQDNGIGFDVAAAIARAIQGETFGLLGLQERVKLLGGEIEIDSAAGNGTCVRVRLPVG